MKDLKYLAAYIIPFLSFIAVYFGGFWTIGPVLFAFVIVPLLEPLLQSSTENLSKQEKENKLSNRFFDVLLFLNLPIILFILAVFVLNIQSAAYSAAELLTLTISLGTLLGASGINVAHELGHRDTALERLWAKALLLPSLYMHFIIEHNRGHHKNIATPEDPASARYEENLYAFWWRSISGGYKHAWMLENKRLKSLNTSSFSFQNEMLVFTVIQLAYLTMIGLFVSWVATIVLFAIAMVSILLLETINYVEHYGLQRSKLANGRYERVQTWHSWNSNHHLGRIVLYELTRHSDHHFQSNKKYQVLDHQEKSPQLPFGYPSSMLMSMIPPLWFNVMNREVKKYDFSHTS